MSLMLNKYIKGFTLIELMIVIAIIAILSAIAIPNFLAYRNKAFCSKVELEAARVGTAISDYYGMPSHTGIPSINDLHITVDNPAIIQAGAGNKILIIVTDGSARCPTDYMAASPNWDATTHKFTKFIQ